jgi:hypothetical protein
VTSETCFVDMLFIQVHKNHHTFCSVPPRLLPPFSAAPVWTLSHIFVWDACKYI